MPWFTSNRLRPPPALAIVASALALILLACDGGGGDPVGPVVDRGEPEGAPRTVQLGLGAVPAESTAGAYVDSFATAAQYADLVLIRKTPPWTDFLPGATISDETTESTELERALLDQYEGLQLFFAIDPTDASVQRVRAFDLPDGVDEGDPFEDPDVRQAFLAYTTYVAQNYRPEYLALGVEVNMTATRNPEMFDGFVSLYREAYTAAKEASPETKVFPTFQLEDLLGLAGEVHPPQWSVFDRFGGAMDVLAVSTYPYFAFDSAPRIPAQYWAQLRENWDGEIVIAETGYPSRPVAGQPVVGTELDQDSFLGSLLAAGEEYGFSLVVWFAARDPAGASTNVTGAFRDIGLRESNGANKTAWSRWEEWARRPLAETPNAGGG